MNLKNSGVVMQWFRKLRAWFSCRQQLAGYRADLHALDAKIARLQTEKDVSQYALEKAMKRLEQINRIHQAETEHTRRIADDLRRIDAKRSEALDAAIEKLKTSDEILIPALIAGIQSVQKTYEADAAIQAVRAHNATSSNRDM